MLSQWKTAVHFFTLNKVRRGVDTRYMIKEVTGVISKINLLDFRHWKHSAAFQAKPHSRLRRYTYSLNFSEKMPGDELWKINVGGGRSAESINTQNSTRIPGIRASVSCWRHAEMWTWTSLRPSEGVMRPLPLLQSKVLTIPVILRDKQIP